MKEMLKKIFITGGTGLLGYHLIKMTPEAYDASCTFFPLNKKASLFHDCDKYYLDISDRNAVLDTLKVVKPDYVVHTASVANVDHVEKNKEEAKKINLGGTMNIIEACQEIEAKLIYTSSNAVFDGKNPPYAENDPVSPLSYYGELKVKEEEEIKRSGLKHAIVRPILMYGWNLAVERKNPVTWLIDLLREGKEVKMVDDILCNPLFVEDCSDVIWKCILLDKEGTFHVGGEDEISRYEFAQFTAEVFGFDVDLIKPVNNSFFPEIAPRPKNTTYCIDKIKKDLGIFPLGVREGLEVMRGVHRPANKEAEPLRET